jgi:hypothetical protein
MAKNGRQMHQLKAADSGLQGHQMGIRILLKRIEGAEEALKAHSIFSQDCICFPEKEQFNRLTVAKSRLHSMTSGQNVL